METQSPISDPGEAARSRLAAHAARKLTTAMRLYWSARELKAAALRAHDIVALALFPLIGEMGMVGCLLVPLETESELREAEERMRAASGMAGKKD